MLLVKFALFECATEFACENGACVAGTARCDGASDCGDLSDELRCGAPCNGAKVYCAADNSCINANRLCDGTDDCSSGLDEDCFTP